MPEVLHAEVVGSRPLAAPTVVHDATTRAAIDAEIAEAVTAAVTVAERSAHTRGLADGERLAREQLESRAAAITAAVDRVHTELVAQRATAVAADLDLVERAVTEVLGVTPPSPVPIVLDRVRAAVAALDDDVLELRVAPVVAASFEDVALDPRVRLVPDDRVADGDAQVTGRWGSADLTRGSLTTAVVAALRATAHLAGEDLAAGARATEGGADDGGPR